MGILNIKQSKVLSVLGAPCVLHRHGEEGDVLRLPCMAVTAELQTSKRRGRQKAARTSVTSFRETTTVPEEALRQAARLVQAPAASLVTTSTLTQ